MTHDLAVDDRAERRREAARSSLEPWECRLLVAVPLRPIDRGMGSGGGLIVAAHGSDGDGWLDEQVRETPLTFDFFYDGEKPPDDPGLWVMEGHYHLEHLFDQREDRDYAGALLASGAWRRPTAAELIAFHQGRNPWA